MPTDKCCSHPLSKQPLTAAERDYPTWSKYKEQLTIGCLPPPVDAITGQGSGSIRKESGKVVKARSPSFCCRVLSFVYDGGCPVKFQPPCSINTTCTMATQIGLQCGPGKELMAPKRGRINISLRMNPLIKFSIPGDHL